jgi:peptidoglycan/LPS O-acetylase OafA/YrhL
LFAALGCGVALMTLAGKSIGTVAMTSYGFSVLALFYAMLLMIAVTWRGSLVAAVARNGLLRRLGIIAYATYMFHQGVSGLCYAFLRGHKPQMVTVADALTTAFALVLTIALAGLSWVIFERPIVRFGHRFHYRIEEDDAITPEVFPVRAAARRRSERTLPDDL